MPLERILTIGVYGFTADRFFAALEASTTDLFCDLRARRGVRGGEYAFANSTRLQSELAARNIEYRHFPALAPSREIRGVQYQADATAGVAKRKRDELDAAFVDRYQELLRAPEAETALAEIAALSAAPILFCVERLPEACHRSLVAARLAEGRQISIENIAP
jgi:uncharacterized protein (DUF488 family)